MSISQAPTQDECSEQVRQFLVNFHEGLCRKIEALDGVGHFGGDDWDRPGGGGGRSRVMTNGKVFEKAGINFSDVRGDALPPSATERRPALAGSPFRAMGVSLVFHPYNPHVPTTHLNMRYFQSGPLPDGSVEWWFGGGFDLTPIYPYLEDAISWHRAAAAAAAEHYPAFKEWCDQYFFIHHRQETRGVGGLFFDDFNEHGFDGCFHRVRRMAEAFYPAYHEIVQRRRDIPFGERERNFQLIRRGRYAEFNLVYDRGTLFGLQSGGRTESILMSLPPLVRWEYNWQPQPGSPEESLTRDFLRPRDWLTNSQSFS